MTDCWTLAERRDAAVKMARAGCGVDDIEKATRMNRFTVECIVIREGRDVPEDLRMRGLRKATKDADQ
jgi:hypothetical protein